MVHLFSEGYPLAERTRRGRTWMVVFHFFLFKFTSKNRAVVNIEISTIDTGIDFHTLSLDLHHRDKRQMCRLKRNLKFVSPDRSFSYR